jgi:hypothetical protein
MSKRVADNDRARKRKTTSTIEVERSLLTWYNISKSFFIAEKDSLTVGSLSFIEKLREGHCRRGCNSFKLPLTKMVLQDGEIVLLSLRVIDKDSHEGSPIKEKEKALF